MHVYKEGFLLCVVSSSSFLSHATSCILILSILIKILLHLCSFR